MWKAAVQGLATFVPGVLWLHKRMTRTGGNTDSASYCHAVWMQHLNGGYQAGLCKSVPRVVAELGPGSSIGAGIAALLSGAECYVGLDVIPFANSAQNLRVLDGLLPLFRDVDEPRVARIRDSIMRPNANDSMVRYIAPWYDSGQIKRGSIDMLFSHAVLEHIDDLQTTYSAMREWLAPGGWISHQIDFRCHGIWPEWNAHWACPEWQWTILRGRKASFLNRQPHSTHMRLLRRAGFNIEVDERATAKALARERLAKRFRHLTPSDLETEGAFIQGRLHSDALGFQLRAN